MTGIIIPDPAGGLVGIHYWDGTTWQKWTGTAPSLFVNIHGYDGAAWQKLLATAGGLLRLAAEADAQRLFVTQTNADILRASAWSRYDGSWYRSPLHWGISDVYSEEVSDLSATAGTNTLNLAAVPAGIVRVITTITARDQNNAPTAIHLRSVIDGGVKELARYATPAAAIGIHWEGHLVLGPTDNLRAVFTGVTLNDDIYVSAHGFDMDLVS